MAERRMFSKRIANSAKFLKMPISSQCLYFHLGLHADDDGIVEAYTIMNAVGASEDDIRVLVAKGFVYVLNEDLVSYITDWSENNKIRPDRKIDSIYKDLLLQVIPDVKLVQKKERADVLKKKASGLPMDYQWTTEGSIGKGNIDKCSTDMECSAPQNTKPTRHKYGEYKNVLFSDEELEKLKTEFPHDWQRRIENLSEYMASSGKSYKNHLATIRKWAKNDTEKQTEKNSKGKGINNYTDANKPDYSNFSEQILKEMLGEN